MCRHFRNRRTQRSYCCFNEHRPMLHILKCISCEIHTHNKQHSGLSPFPFLLVLNVAVDGIACDVRLNGVVKCVWVFLLACWIKNSYRIFIITKEKSFSVRVHAEKFVINLIGDESNKQKRTKKWIQNHKSQMGWTTEPHKRPNISGWNGHWWHYSV